MVNEQPVYFDCAGERLLGIMHAVEGQPEVGVLLVVGGPQYRVGSHRQFVLLARDLAAAGIPVFRFDYRGMGDSGGAMRDFEGISDDIRCALDVLFEQQPGMRGAVLWGLCDAATANAFYAGEDPRVVGQIALNPWVRTTEGVARVFMRHYYPRRALSGAFWRRLTSLRGGLGAALRDFAEKLRYLRNSGNAGGAGDTHSLPWRFREAQLGFRGQTLVILSGQDLTAKEYQSQVAESLEWQRWLQSSMVTVRKLEDADHTFSRAAWRTQVAQWSRDWIANLGD
ncbi:MAG: hydrolase 1, exosortase A system-associated [Chromatiaceae bacterium]|nr:hydrolase 1, exosortase A system-associated [Gammaproteobacteria bacterium]MCP5315671.1 hydrolase 1, exosortase A system-associated [Chromatiaceae bacterium]